MRRYRVTLDGGRQFIIYAEKRTIAVRKLMEAKDVVVYDGVKPVPLGKLGHVINATRDDRPAADIKRGDE